MKELTLDDHITLQRRYNDEHGIFVILYRHINLIENGNGIEEVPGIAGIYRGEVPKVRDHIVNDLLDRIQI